MTSQSAGQKPAQLRRFLPYLLKYKRTRYLRVFCAALTTICDIVLPSIMRYLTNAATDPSVVLTTGIVVRLALLYLVLRLVDGAASYYMSGTGHIMGVLHRDRHAPGRFRPPAAAEPYLLFQHQGRADHGPDYQRPV